MPDATLVVISPLRGFQPLPDTIVLTKKFVSGMKLYHHLWGGPVLHVCAPADRPSDNLDNIEVAIKTSEFDTICAPLTSESLRRSIPRNSVVLASVGEDFNLVSAICREIGVPCVYVTEYTLKTRLQIISETRHSLVHGAWQMIRQIQQEIAQRKAVSISTGVQCNGLPTFTAYSGLADSLLFFDTRTEAAMLATEELIERKMNGTKLRLVFSGRLTLMKGVDDLVEVAEHLRNRLGDGFDLSIFGDGDYRPTLKRRIDDKGLSNVVRLRGNLDFATELLSEIKEAHLFVCCHRQGDPSCTYLETMACGVPIIGYANEAWSQLSKYSGTGWVTPLGKPGVMAGCISKLSRELMISEGLKALNFAAAHTFEMTFQKRIDHLKSMAL